MLFKMATYKKIVSECASNFENSLEQKIKDYNRAKSTINDSHKRTVVSYPLHMEVFFYLYIAIASYILFFQHLYLFSSS